MFGDVRSKDIKVTMNKKWQERGKVAKSVTDTQRYKLNSVESLLNQNMFWVTCNCMPNACDCIHFLSFNSYLLDSWTTAKHLSTLNPVSSCVLNIEETLFAVIQIFCMAFSSNSQFLPVCLEHLRVPVNTCVQCTSWCDIVQVTSTVFRWLFHKCSGYSGLVTQVIQMTNPAKCCLSTFLSVLW